MKLLQSWHLNLWSFPWHEHNQNSAFKRLNFLKGSWISQRHMLTSSMLIYSPLIVDLFSTQVENGVSYLVFFNWSVYWKILSLRYHEGKKISRISNVPESTSTKRAHFLVLYFSQSLYLFLFPWVYFHNCEEFLDNTYFVETPSAIPNGLST